MRTIKFTTLLFLILTTVLRGQENTINNGIGLGFHINQCQRDFGLGVDLTSRFVARQHLALRVRANLMYHEHSASSGGEYTWTPYSNISLGLIGVGGMVGNFIRLYGEGGLICLFPSTEFSSENKVLGGYGVFGFEFFMNRSLNYYMEIGGVGTGAQADKMTMKPIYSNGLVIAAGFRCYL